MSLIETVLVVDDDELSREFVRETCQGIGLNVREANDGKQAVESLRQQGADLVLTDLRMPKMNGVDLLRWISDHQPDTAVVLMTAFGTVESAVDALRGGAEDILLKPFGPDQVALMVERLRSRRALKTENEYLRAAVAEEHGSSEILGNSPQIQSLSATLRKIAPTRATVFVQGESGTGKELVSRAIHRYSDRSSGPFVRVNCAALSETLLESELFGHERGAFTGAHQRKPGRFELAHGGTLLLDEVSEISPAMQAKLLRVLEEEEFERVGGTKTLSVDVRVIATSNRDLDDEIKAGRFRSDLYYRLHVLPVQLPPLRERATDIPILVHNFLDRFSQEIGCAAPRLNADALAAMSAYPWPGNVRELRNFVQRLVVLRPDTAICAADLDLPRHSGLRAGSKNTHRTMEEMERDAILDALHTFGGNRTKAAEVLGVTPRTITNKIRLYRSQGHQVPPPARAPRPKASASLDEELAEALA